MKQVKSELIQIKVTTEQRKQIESRAEKNMMNVSEYIRLVALGKLK